VPPQFRDSNEVSVARGDTEPHAGDGSELWGLRKNGTEFPVEISVSPLATGKGILVSTAIRDITKRRLLEDELVRRNEEIVVQYRRLQETSRLKSEFLANMSHELRTPLNAIIGFSELIHDGKAGEVNANQKEYLGDVLTSSRHLLDLINGVLDLAKVEAGKTEFRPEAVNLPELIGEVVDALRTLAAQKNIRIELPEEMSVNAIFTDRSKLKQVLYNYLSNALKFTPNGGRVGVHVLPEGASAFRLEVEDTGIGVAASDLGRLFVEFQQLDASTAKKYPGTGLGLALLKRIVEAQGGSVGVESVLGKGSTFWAVLPRVAAEIAETASSPLIEEVRAQSPFPATPQTDPHVL
jgi:signal transduction histidine kinase